MNCDSNSAWHVLSEAVILCEMYLMWLTSDNIKERVLKFGVSHLFQHTPSPGRCV